MNMTVLYEILLRCFLVILVLVLCHPQKALWLAAQGRMGLGQPPWLDHNNSDDIQLLLGIVVWIMQQQWMGLMPLPPWEHPVTMFLTAPSACHVGASRNRRSPQTSSNSGDQLFIAGPVGFGRGASAPSSGVAA